MPLHSISADDKLLQILLHRDYFHWYISEVRCLKQRVTRKSGEGVSRNTSR